MKPALRLMLLLGCCLALPAMAQEGPGCGAPSALLDAAPLPVTSAAIANGRLHVLVVGPASVDGLGVSVPDAAWPRRLDALLRDRRPDLDLRVSVHAIRGSTVADQWQVIEQRLRATPYDLVIWQAGTVEAVRGLPIDQLAATLQNGLETLKDDGLDVIVLGIQFSRFLRANVEVEPYRDTLRMVAATTGAAHFPRYDLMRAWAEAGTVDVERTPPPRRTAAIDRLNDCIARALSVFLRRGAREARR